MNFACKGQEVREIEIPLGNLPLYSNNEKKHITGIAVVIYGAIGCQGTIFSGLLKRINWIYVKKKSLFK